MASSGSFLRQLSSKEGMKSTSKRWIDEWGLKMCGNNENGVLNMRKRVMVVVDQTCHSKHAMMWALTHITNKADMLTLLHILPPSLESSTPNTLACSLASLCKSCKPEVEVEAVMVEGPKLETVMSQVKELGISVLVLAQNKSSPLLYCMFGSSSSEEFVEECIKTLDCLTIGVRKQNKGVGGYLITTRCHKNFWLLA